MASRLVVTIATLALGLVLASPPVRAADERAPGSWPSDALRWLRGARSAPASTPVDGAALEAALQAEVNAERAAHGVPPLAPDPRLGAVARAHSRDMADRGYFGHFDPEGRGPGERLQRAYAEWRGAYAENVYHVSAAHALEAHERTPAALARRIVRGWMASPGHRANLLRAEMSLGSLGVWATPHDVWATHLLGRPIAILASPVPACVPVGRAWKLALQLGPDLATPGRVDAILVWPDPTRRFPRLDGTYLEGAEPLAFRRTRGGLELSIPGQQPPGTYRLHLGRDDRYYDLGEFQVRAGCLGP